MAQGNRSRLLAYVGTYTGGAASSGDGEGIYRFEVDPASGLLSERTLVAATPNPSWIVIHPSKKYLYAANEVSNYQGGNGSVSGFAISGDGSLQPINQVSSHGAGPAYLSIDKSGRYVLAANYGGGSIAVLPIAADGALGPPTNVRQDSGSLGSTHPTDAPPGSFAISGHDAPHVHMVHPAPGGSFVIATDLGQDRIYVYRFSAGKLLPAATPYVEVPSGDGPRHFAFHSNGRWMYSVQEEASTILLFDYDAASGSLKARTTSSTLPPGFAGTSFASEIRVSSDGRFVYAGNRLHNTIAIFSVATDGGLNRIGEVATGGDYCNQFQLSPDGRFLYACNRRSDNLTVFKIDRGSGMLTFTGQYVAVGSPGSITFLD